MLPSNRHRLHLLFLVLAAALIVGGFLFVHTGLAAAPTITITTASLPDGAIGAYYNQFIAATSTNATDTLTWSIASGTLPSGLSLSSATGEIIGTSTAVGVSSFTVQVSGANPSSTPATQIYTLTSTGQGNTNGIYIDDFTNSSGINSQTNADVNTATGAIQLKGTDGSFSAPYNASGSLNINDIRPLSVAKWGMVSLVATTPTGTTITVQVMDDNNSLYSDTYVPGNSTGVSSFPVDLSEVPVLQCADTPLTAGTDCNKPQMIRLKVTLTTSNPSVTPAIDSLQFTWTVKQGDLSSSTFSTAPWAIDTGTEQGTDQSRYTNASIYPAIRWASQKYADDYYLEGLYALNDKLVGWRENNVGSMFAMNRDNGSELWQLPFSCVPSAGVVAQNGTFYGTDEGTDLFFAIDTNTGQIKWTYNFYGGHGNNQTVIGNDGSIYTVRNNTGLVDTVYAFNPDGTVKWTQDITNVGGVGDRQGYMSIGRDGTLYYGTSVYDSDYNSLDEGKLYALNPTDGSVKWTYDTGDLNGEAPLIDSSGTIYVGNYFYPPNYDIKLYAINPDGTLKWEKDFGTGDDGIDSLALRSDGNFWMVYELANDTGTKLIEISSVDGSVLWSSNVLSNNYSVMSDSANGAYFTDSNSDVATATIERLNYYDPNHNLKWQMPYVYDSTADGDNVSYGYSFLTNPIDERGWVYSGLGRIVFDQNGNELVDQDYDQVFALAPWTITPSTDASSYLPGNSVKFSVTTSMQQTNLLTSDPNQMQVVLDDGTKIPLVYGTTTTSGDTVWTANYSLPSSASLGSHAYTVDANAAGIVTDIPVEFSDPAPNSSSTGLIATSSFTVAVPTPSASGGANVGGGGSAYDLSINAGASSVTTTSVTLSLYGTEAYTMEVANNSTFAAATWIPYVTTMPWTLASTPGAETVYVQFRSVGGSIVGSAQASIDLVPPGTSVSPSSPSPTTTTPAATLSTTSLTAELAALQAELAALESQAGQSTSGSSVPSYVFTRNLSFWMTGSDVMALQQYLIAENAGSAVARLKVHGVTKTFGLLTYNALMEFQKKAGITPASGYFGPKTRAYVNAHE